MSNYKQKLLNLKRGQFILYASILALFVVFIWIGGSIFISQQNTEIPDNVQRAARPLNPNIDVEVIEHIEQKRDIPPIDLRNFPIYTVQRSSDGRSQQVVPIGTEVPEFTN